jgi:hypothetical protein
VSNSAKKKSSTTFSGLLGPLTVLTATVFDLKGAAEYPYVFATLPGGRAVRLYEPGFAQCCMDCEAKRSNSGTGRRENYPYGNPEEYSQEIPNSVLFGLEAGDTILAEAMQDSDDGEGHFWVDRVFRIVNGKAVQTQPVDDAEAERAKPALVS